MGHSPYENLGDLTPRARQAPASRSTGQPCEGRSRAGQAMGATDVALKCLSASRKPIGLRDTSLETGSDTSGSAGSGITEGQSLGWSQESKDPVGLRMSFEMTIRATTMQRSTHDVRAKSSRRVLIM
jgi:hypothetical protein